MPVNICDLSNLAMPKNAVVENGDRGDIHPLEQTDTDLAVVVR